jgi:hypothetical protein
MFKLIGIGGLIRGESYSLQEGINVFGQASSCDFQVVFDGISKEHFSLKMVQGNLYLEDQGSSNGTFVNQKIVQSKTLSEGDVIAIPNAIFKVVRIDKKIVYIKNEQKEKFEENPIPQDLKGKLLYYFDSRLMAPIYSLNKSYEWSSMLFILVFLFVVLNILFTTDSILKTSNEAVLKETIARVKDLAAQVKRETALLLSKRAYQQIDLNFLDTHPDVKNYFLFDRNGRIIRPIESLNIGINDSFSVSAKDYIESKGSDFYLKKIEDDKIGIALAIKAYNLQRQREDIVGYISIVFAPISLKVMSSDNRVIYLRTLIISSILGLFFVGTLYFLTIKYFKEVSKQWRSVQTNKIKEIKSEMLFKEANFLIDELNALNSRIREMNSDGEQSFDDVESDYTYLITLGEILKSIPSAGMILNSEKKIEALNLEGEDLLGIRENSAKDASVEDVLRDQGLVATIISLCDETANNSGIHCNEIYDINGTSYQVNSFSLIGKDSFAKGYLISFGQNL